MLRGNPLHVLSTFLAAFLGFTIIQLYHPWGVDTQKKSGGWAIDPHAQTLELDDRCDFDRRNFKDLSVAEFLKVYRGRKPVVISGGIVEEWPAVMEWRKDRLMKRYGNRSIRVGMASDIVNSAGFGVSLVEFGEFLDSLGHNASTDLFSFDVDFPSLLPEMFNHFETPRYFHGFSGSKRQGQSGWPILSIGGSRSGLPFHVHGETWLAVVFGAKRWFIYPPSQSLGGTDLFPSFPLLTVWQWFWHVYGQLPAREKPLECVQRSGDIIYLPRAWKHLTVNIGETIGVGGQAVYTTEERFRDSLKTIKTNPKDFEALNGLGLALAHRGSSPHLPPNTREKFLNESLDYFKRAIAVRPCQPQTYALAGEVLMMLPESRHEAANEIIRSGQELLSSIDSSCAYINGSIIASDLSFAAAHGKFARFYIHTGKLDDAVSALYKSLSFSPNFTDSLGDLELVNSLKLDKARRGSIIT